MAELIFAEQTLPFSDRNGGGVYEPTVDSYPDPFPLVVGETYTVLWDGVEYVCAAEAVVFAGIDGIGIGNLSIEELGDDTGEPFLIGYAPAYSTTLVETTDKAETHTIAIYKGVLTKGANIVLYDRNGEPVTYEGIETVSFNTDKGDIATYTHGTATNEVAVALDLSAGDQTVAPEGADLMKKVVIEKPDTLLPENIKRGVEIAGVAGDLIGEGVSKEVALSLADGDQTVEADPETLMSEVIIKKPETLLPENIAEGVNIAGVVGTMPLANRVTFLDEDGTQLFKMPVLVGDDCKDPVDHGDIEAPEKEDTNTIDYVRTGWTAASGGTADADILKNITADKTVYAAYVANTRYYTVNFYDEDGTTLLKTVEATYGADLTDYVPEREGYDFVEWNPSVANITSEFDTVAVWVESAKDEWDYLAKSVANGTYKTDYALGDTIPITYIREGDGAQMSLNMVLVAFDHDDKADGSGKAAMTFVSDTMLLFSVTKGEASSEWWGNSMQRTTLRSSEFNGRFPTNVTKQIKPVTKLSQKADSTLDSTVDSFWLLSATEIGFTSTSNSNIIDGQGAHYSNWFTGDARRIAKTTNGTNGMSLLRGRSNTTSWHKTNYQGGFYEAKSATATGTGFVGFCI